MNSFVKIFIAGGVFCLFLFNSKAVSCEQEYIFPFADDDLVSQNSRQVLEMQPVRNSSSPSALPNSRAFPIDTATALPEASAILAERNKVRFPIPQADLAGFLPLLEMGEDVIFEALKFSARPSECKNRRYGRDSNVFFINPGCIISLNDIWRYERDGGLSSINPGCNISHDDIYSCYQYFIVAANGEEAALIFNAVENFKREKRLTLLNQIKIVLFNLYDSKMPTTPFNDTVPKENIVSFILEDNIKGRFVLLKDLCFSFHWKKWPGIRITVPLSNRRLFTQEILSDTYRRVLRQWHSRIDTIDLGIFENESEAAEGMLDVIGNLPPSASRWNIF